jgi:hypothetical protein
MGLATHGVAEGMSASKTEWLIKRSDAYTTLQTASDVIHVPLERVDKL